MVIAKVISQEGHCPIGHNPGDVIKFDHFGARGDICINALFTMLPVVYAMMHNAYFPWSQDHCKELHACPDPKNPVEFHPTHMCCLGGQQSRSYCLPINCDVTVWTRCTTSRLQFSNRLCR
ncbi:MAG: TIGR04076 family protein [Candidatus Thorarchaeota archaeon]